MQSANRFSALESDDEVEVPQVPVKKQVTEKKVEKKTDKKQVVSVKQEQEKKPKNKNEGVEMEYKKQDSRRGIDHSGRDTHVARQGKRQFDRRDGTGRGLRNSKKEGAGQHNWGNEVEEELNDLKGVEEVSQVPLAEQVNIEKSEEIGKGIEESETTKEQEENTKPEVPKEKQLTLEEFRKQQQQARKTFQNKELFAARQERTADFPADEQVQKITTLTDDDLIKASITNKNKKKKVQRSQKTVVLEKDAIGFSPNARRVPRADKPKVEGSQQNGEHHEGGRPRGDQKDGRPRGDQKDGRPRDDQKDGRPRGPRPGPRKINVQDDKLFPVLKH